MSQVWQNDLYDCLSRYHDFMDKLEAYPEWKDKVVEDVGKWFHMINNNLAESDIKTRIFAKMVQILIRRTGRNILCDGLYGPIIYQPTFIISKSLISQFYLHVFAVDEILFCFLGQGIADDGKIGLGKIVASYVDLAEGIGALEVQAYFSD